MTAYVKKTAPWIPPTVVNNHCGMPNRPRMIRAKISMVQVRASDIAKSLKRYSGDFVDLVTISRLIKRATK